MRDLWAHSRNRAGARHRLEDHLRGTAERARSFGEPFGAGELTEYLGLVHDVGKASCAWQAGLLSAEQTGAKVGIPHKQAGTWLAQRAAGPFALCVYGHHGGLPEAAELKGILRGASAETVADWEAVAADVARMIPEILRPAPGSLSAEAPGEARDRDKLVLEMLVRMVFSALVDADFLDTETHFHGNRRPASETTAGDLAGVYEDRRAALLAGRRPSPADRWRQEVYAQAVAAASGPGGMYRMAAPTGSGKTLSAGAFALHHAKAHGLRRVVVAVPFISITEQNADVYRAMLDEPGRPRVLEHHSGADLDGIQPGDWWRRLAAENWDAPFVVTTTVQLFQSLFAHRPAAMRKVHRLARSVIVLDEVQALPDRLLMPILSVLRVLTERFGTTVLLASATQPSYWDLPPFRDLEVANVISDPRPLYRRFRRVRYRWRLEPRPALAEVAAEAACERQVLIVVNTTADSATVHRYLAGYRDESLGPCFHLSTRMAAQHRRDVLARIRERLDAAEPVAVVSTQLIEAGVDVDFPVVYRAWAPADSLQQAAGRANRNARLAEGTVVIFDPADGGRPADSSYNAALNATLAHFGPGRADPDDLDALDRYYPERYNLQNLHRVGPGVEIEALRREMDFPEVARCFQLIDDKTTPVTVRYGDDSALARLAEVIGRLRGIGNDHHGAGEARHLLRELRPYLATIPTKLARKAVAAGCAEPIIGDLLEWHGPYQGERGINSVDLAALGQMEVQVW